MSKKTETLSMTEWLALLPAKQKPARERVIVVRKCKQPLTIKNYVWSHFLRERPGIAFADEGRSVCILPDPSGNKKAEIPQWAIEKLRLGGGDLMCVSQTPDAVYLKKLVLCELASEVPSTIVFDQFTDTTVKRHYSLKNDCERSSRFGAGARTRNWYPAE